MDGKIIVKGNCMWCKKELKENDGLFLCNECQNKLKVSNMPNEIPTFDYESPIKTIYDQMNSQWEDGILKATQKVGIFVNKEELIKALNYDRNQYETGYKNGYSIGYSDACQENWVYNEKPDNDGRYLVIVKDGHNKRIVIGKFSKGQWMMFQNLTVLAWQNLPEIPEMEE